MPMLGGDHKLRQRLDLDINALLILNLLSEGTYA